MRRFLFVVVVTLVFCASGGSAYAYVAPVQAPIVDPYRAPTNPYGPGNRGVDYATTPGSPVAVSAPGVVSFAGQVGGKLYVVVQHPDGLRTTYGLLQSIAVAVGQLLDQASVVGRAGDSLHFGVRRGDEYLDPMSLLTVPAHLVPIDAASPAGWPSPITDAGWQWLSDPTRGRPPMRRPTQRRLPDRNRW